MDSETNHHIPNEGPMGDGNQDKAIQEVISKVKSHGLFDQFRKECLADVDTKPAYHNLLQRVEKFVERFLHGQKWSSSANKNQLRETLRRQLNNSGMMNNGVERIIEQVVNPKILLGIKPRIDEAVSDHLGIDLKARQEEQQRRKQEQQRLMIQQQQQLQQQHLQGLMNQNMKSEEAFPPGGIAPPPAGAPWNHTAPGAFPALSAPDVAKPIPGTAPFYPHPMGAFGGVAQPFPFMGGWPPGLPGMEGFNQTMQPMILGQPMIPPLGGGMSPGPAGIIPFSTAVSPAQTSVIPTFSSPPVSNQTNSTQIIPDFSKPPPGLHGKSVHSSAASVGSSPANPGIPSQSSPMVPPGIIAPSVGTIRPPPPGSVPPPPGTVPVIPPASSHTSPGAGIRHPSVPTTPTIPALISHTLSKVSKDELTPEKIAVFKTAAAFITKTVSNAQSMPGADLATMFSPRVLAEAMMAESGKPMTKHEIRAAKRKERMKEIDRLRAERNRETKEDEKMGKEGNPMDDKEDPLPPKHNLMDVFQAAEDVSDDEEALNMLLDVEESEDKHKQGIVFSDESDNGEDQPPTSQPGKRYNFAWDVDKDPGVVSDVSSIHTSDISSFEDDITSENEEEKAEQTENPERTEEVEAVGESTPLEQSLTSQEDDSKVLEISSDKETDHGQQMSNEKPTEPKEVQEVDATVAQEVDATVAQEETSTPDKESLFASDVVPLIPPIFKPKYSPKATLEASKPRKLLALSYKYSDSEDEESREERKARIGREKEERYLRRQQRRAELETKKKEREEEKARQKEEKKAQDVMLQSQDSETLQMTESAPAPDNVTSAIGSADDISPNKSTPRKRKNKAEMKEQLHQQKVMEKRAFLRRRRTRNRRYASDEFTSIFSERKALTQSYTDSVVDAEEIVTFDGTVDVVEMTVDQECVVETVGEVVETVESGGNYDKMSTTTKEKEDIEQQSTDLVLQCPSPYSDISDKSMSDKSEVHKSDVEMENVSSEEEEEEKEEDVEDKEGEVAGWNGNTEGTRRVRSASLASSVSDKGQTVEEKKGTPARSGLGSSPFNSWPAAQSVSGDSTRDGSTETSRYTISEDHGRSERYAMDDLYKSRDSHRRGVTPTFYERDTEASPSRRQMALESDGNAGESQKVEDRRRSHTDGVVEITKESQDQPPADEPVSREPVNIMGDLDLEPVSDEDSPFDDMEGGDSASEIEKEEGEEKDSDGEVKANFALKFEQKVKVGSGTATVEKKTQLVEGGVDDASDEGEIKTDSDEQIEEVEEDKGRQANRKPIELVDFGEAEKRARESRSYFPEERRTSRTSTLSTASSYRSGYPTWQTAEQTIPSGYAATGSRFISPHETPHSTNIAKSPAAASFDGESEASSHSRASARVRDDAPPLYHMESGGRKPRSPTSDQGSSSMFKATMSPPSPVSSSSSHSDSSVSHDTRPKLKSRSRSRSSSASSSSSRSSHRKKKKAIKRSKRRRKYKESSSGKLLVPEKTLPTLPQESFPSHGEGTPARERYLSSGHESISSDELPYFPDGEEQSSPKIKRKRSSSNKSSSSSSSGSLRVKRKKKGVSPDRASISSSELIYSPRRLKSPSQLSEGEREHSDIPRPPMSPGQSSMSSGEIPDYPGRRLARGRALGYSPHRPSSPSEVLPIDTDFEGFQPPLPQDLPPELSDMPTPPPLPSSPPPLPPPPEDNEEAELPPLPPEEEEEEVMQAKSLTNQSDSLSGGELSGVQLPLADQNRETLNTVDIQQHQSLKSAASLTEHEHSSAAENTGVASPSVSNSTNSLLRLEDDNSRISEALDSHILRSVIKQSDLCTKIQEENGNVQVAINDSSLSYQHDEQVGNQNLQCLVDSNNLVNMLDSNSGPQTDKRNVLPDVICRIPEVSNSSELSTNSTVTVTISEPRKCDLSTGVSNSFSSSSSLQSHDSKEGNVLCPQPLSLSEENSECPNLSQEDVPNILSPSIPESHSLSKVNASSEGEASERSSTESSNVLGPPIENSPSSSLAVLVHTVDTALLTNENKPDDSCRAHAQNVQENASDNCGHSATDVVQPIKDQNSSCDKELEMELGSESSAQSIGNRNANLTSYSQVHATKTSQLGSGVGPLCELSCPTSQTTDESKPLNTDCSEKDDGSPRLSSTRQNFNSETPSASGTQEQLKDDLSAEERTATRNTAQAHS